MMSLRLLKYPPIRKDKPKSSYSPRPTRISGSLLDMITTEQSNLNRQFPPFPPANHWLMLGGFKWNCPRDDPNCLIRLAWQPMSLEMQTVDVKLVPTIFGFQCAEKCVSSCSQPPSWDPSRVVSFMTLRHSHVTMPVNNTSCSWKRFTPIDKRWSHDLHLAPRGSFGVGSPIEWRAWGETHPLITTTQLNFKGSWHQIGVENEFPQV